MKFFRDMGGLVLNCVEIHVEIQDMENFPGFGSARIKKIVTSTSIETIRLRTSMKVVNPKPNGSLCIISQQIFLKN